MTRKSIVSQDSIQETLKFLDRTTVIVVGVGGYDELGSLAGVTHDLDMIMDIFLENPDISIFKKAQVKLVPDPTNNELRNVITEYTQSRTARGDILVFYYSGHGCILPSGPFGFCPKDTNLNAEGEILPISVVSITDVLDTLSVSDIHPVFIVDACFSSAISTQTPSLGKAALESSWSRANVGPRALLASSGPTTESRDSENGGLFTQALYKTIHSGLTSTEGSKLPYLTLKELDAPLLEELTLMGPPLSRYHVEGAFPALPIARNPGFRPTAEYFSGTYKRIVMLLWNEGDPQICKSSEFSDKIGQGAYSNHSKLDLEPWGLLEDVDSRSYRKLTKKGMKFAAGEIKIPKKISKDPVSGTWKKAAKSQMISIDDV
jgi:hypothetical protein